MSIDLQNSTESHYVSTIFCLFKWTVYQIYLKEIKNNQKLQHKNNGYFFLSFTTWPHIFLDKTDILYTWQSDHNSFFIKKSLKLSPKKFNRIKSRLLNSNVFNWRHMISNIREKNAMTKNLALSLDRYIC